MPTLEWIGKEKVINHHQEVPFRVLERQYSFDENGQHTEDNGSENMIIHGDNLDALKALLPRYEGRVKCIPNADNTDGFKEPLEMKAAEAVTGSVSAYYNDTVSDGSKNANGSVTVDGVKYNYNGIYAYDEAMGNELSVSGSSYTLGSKASYTFFLDSQGYVIGAKVEDAAISDFAYVIDAAKSGFNNIVKVLLSNGEIKTYTVSSKSDDNGVKGNIYGYTINSDGEIVLSAIITTGTAAKNEYVQPIKGGTIDSFTKGSTVIGYSSTSTMYANDETVFVYYNAAKNTATLYVGKDNAPSITKGATASAVYREDSKDLPIAQYIVITTAAETSVTDNYVYVLDNAYRGTSVDKDENTIYWYDAVIGGEVKTIAVEEKTVGSTEITAPGVYKYSVNTTLFDGDSANNVEAGVYTVEKMTGADEIATSKVVSTVVSNTITSGSDAYQIGPDTVIVDVTDTNDVKFDETVEAGDTITVVFETTNNLKVAKTVIITANVAA